MKYVLYEGENGNMLFTREELVASNPSVLDPFENKTPTWATEAESDEVAVTLLNSQMIIRSANK